jgi:hypothetical protein
LLGCFEDWIFFFFFVVGANETRGHVCFVCFITKQTYKQTPEGGGMVHLFLTIENFAE